MFKVRTLSIAQAPYAPRRNAKWFLDRAGKTVWRSSLHWDNVVYSFKIPKRPQNRCAGYSSARTHLEKLLEMEAMGYKFWTRQPKNTEQSPVKL